MQLCTTATYSLVPLQDLPKDPLNYSLYLPASGGGKLGKFLDDGYLLSHYAMQGKIPRLEVRLMCVQYTYYRSVYESLHRCRNLHAVVGA